SSVCHVGQTLTQSCVNSASRFSAYRWRPWGCTGYKPSRASARVQITRARLGGGFVMNSVSHGFAEQPVPLTPVGPLLGASPAMQEVFRLIERVGPTEASVLLTGESGSGKELAARSIHESSLRRGGPFIAINCGAIPAGLLEA